MLGAVHILRNTIWGSRQTPPPPSRLCNTVINRVDPVKLRFLQNST